MTNETWNAVWERVRSGGHVVMIGAGALPSIPSDLKVLQVSCDAPGSSSGPLDTARRKVLQFLGDEPQVTGPTPGQLEAGLRRRLFGDFPGPALEARFVEVCNRLADRTPGGAALVLEGLDTADESTLESLIHILQRPGWLHLPLVLTFQGRPEGRALELINLIRQNTQDDGLLEIGLQPTPHAPSPTFAWEGLPSDVVRVLRAGSVCGATFDADVVARLLDVPLEFVLERLQAAADLGVPLIDRGEARFSLPSEAVQALHSRMLPSLLSFWHGRLGDILSGAPARGDRAQPQSEVSTMAEPTSAQCETDGDIPGVDSQDPQSSANYAELFEPEQRPDTPPQLTPEAASSTPGADLARPSGTSWQMGGDTGFPARSQPDQARAAAHLQASGRTEAAVEQALAAVREVALQGDARRAYNLTAQALQWLDSLPTSAHRALLRSQLLLERAKLQWHGALMGAPFTLQEALRSLEAARESLPDESPPDVVAQLAATAAGVCYDLGDPTSLQQALAELTEVSRLLLATSEPLLAACLLNDQAAVYLRLGDPVRAAHLLEESRKLFEGRLRAQPDEVMAAEELAETHHLLARLALHAAIRPGREADAYAISMEHARMAEQAYQRLDRHLALARVWETMGRLELQRGQPTAAQERLATAFTLQRQLGDAIGLARSTAALADLHSSMGQTGEALGLLANSIALNFEKGSPLGLAMNRRALDNIARGIAQSQGADAMRLRNALAEVEHRLVQAESILGRVELPGEVGGRL